MSFTYLSSSDDREQWLADRRGLITATDVVTLATSSIGGWTRLKAEKAGLGKPFQGNQYTAWGHEREPVIAGIMQAKYPWLNPNSLLVRNDDDPRWGCTPDMIGDAGLCQIKTELWKGSPRTEPEKSHAIQCQWELLVTGMDENILVYEPYEETEFGFRLVDQFADPQEFLIKRDDDQFAELIDLAESFLRMGEPSPMDALLADYADAKAKADAAAADVAAVKEKILAEVGDRDSYKHVSEGIGAVSLSTPKPTERFDSNRFKKERPDEYQEFVKVSQAKPSLRITMEDAA